MKKKSYFDLHCDTLTRRFDFNKEVDTLNLKEDVISVDNIPDSRNYGQFFAVFMPEEYRGDSAVDFFQRNVANFFRQCDKFKDKVDVCRNYEDIMSAYEEEKIAAVLTIEGGSAFAGKLENVKAARDLGVCACTLTWNGENEIASGNYTDHGVSSFGRECIREMERNNIIVDVSHLNDRGFYDVLDIVTRPFIATHSNAREETGHLRNLKDDQIKEIISAKGLIGLNFCTEFLNNDDKKACLEDVFRHAYRILELGGEDVLALGSDFDGTVLPPDLNTLEKSFALGDYFVKRGIPEENAEKIMAGNALTFFKEYFKNGI